MLELGAWLAPVALVVLLLVVGPGASYARRVRIFRRARRLRADLGAPVAPVGFVDGAPAVLEGCLETRGKTVARPGDDVPVATSSVVVDDGGEGRTIAHEQASGLSLAMGGVSVELVGPLDLRVGVRERHVGLTARWARRRLRARLPAAAREVDGTLVVRSVAPADRVLVVGSLRRVSAAEDVALYREAAARWRLVPAHEGGTLPLVSGRRPRVAGPAALVWARRSALALTAFALVFVGGGELAMRTGHTRLATLAPLHRAAALGRMFDRERRATSQRAGDGALLERLAVLPELADRCDEAVDVLARLDQGERAAHLAERCGTAETLAQAGEQWVILGRWDRAAAAYAGTPRRGTAAVHAALGARDFVEAARVLDALPPTDGTAGCVSLALRARVREAPVAAQARELLRQATGSAVPATRLTCGLLLADLLDGRERIALLDSLPVIAPGSQWALIERLLRWEAEPSRVPTAQEDAFPIGARPSSLGYAYGPFVDGAPALEAAVLARLSPRQDAPALALRARLATSRATLEAIAGQPEPARAWLADAERALELSTGAALPADGTPPFDAALPFDVAPRSDLAGLAASIELRGGDPEAARRVADARAPWQRANLDFAIREVAGLHGARGTAPAASATLERIFVRQGARLMEARLAHDDAAAGQLAEAVGRLRALLLDRSIAVPLAMLSLPRPSLPGAPEPGIWSGGLGGTSGEVTDPVVRRMHQIYELYGAPETPFFPIGTLRQGGAATFPFASVAGQCRSYVAVGGPGVLDVDLVVTTPDGGLFRDASHGDLAIARACTTATGSTRVEIRMTMSVGPGAVALQSFAQQPGAVR